MQAYNEGYIADFSGDNIITPRRVNKDGLQDVGTPIETTKGSTHKMSGSASEGVPEGTINS